MQAPGRDALVTGNENEPPLTPNANSPKDWRINREVRFTWRQQRQREWISFREIAEWCAERSGQFNEVELTRAYDMLQRDLLNGDFEERGRSKVLYLHFRTTMAKMTPQRLLGAIDTFSSVDIRSQYLDHCWLPRRIFRRWLAKHGLPPSPSRFEPRKNAQVPTSVSDETAAIKALAEHLKQDEQITRDEAAEWCRQAGFKFTERGFRFRIWPKSRKKAELPELAAPGRKPKSVR
jgi:hypothetical protein